MKIKNKNILVYGMSVSGEWAVKLLNKKGANVYVFDDNKDIIKTKSLINCFLVQSIDTQTAKMFDYVILSPSIELTNPNLQILESAGVTICSEVEFAAKFAKNLLAVTGTNGKTTTVELITAILNKKYNAVACGNIGYTLSQAVLENKNAIKVVEVSSFMLEHAKTFHPYIATILNIEPDHLIRHKTFEEYYNVKCNLFSNLTQQDYAVINLDKNVHPNQKAMTITYSINHPADVFIKDGYINLYHRKLIAINQLPIKGKHNLQNIMCAICFASIMKVPDKLIVQALTEFKLDDYRCQKVGEVNGVSFINDSKSTNIASTLACVDSLHGSVVLMLGGSNKGLEYGELFKKLSKKVKHVLVYGKIAEDLILANNSIFNITACKNFVDAFKKATEIAIKGDFVVLSPATASYDEFSSYIQRGLAFNQKVKDYENKATKV